MFTSEDWWSKVLEHASESFEPEGAAAWWSICQWRNVASINQKTLVQTLLELICVLTVSDNRETDRLLVLSISTLNNQRRPVPWQHNVKVKVTLNQQISLEFIAKSMNGPSRTEPSVCNSVLLNLSSSEPLSNTENNNLFNHPVISITCIYPSFYFNSAILFPKDNQNTHTHTHVHIKISVTWHHLFIRTVSLAAKLRWKKDGSRTFCMQMHSYIVNFKAFPSAISTRCFLFFYCSLFDLASFSSLYDFVD